MNGKSNDARQRVARDWQLYRIGSNPEAKEVNKERQRNLPSSERDSDPSAPGKVTDRSNARDDRARTRRDYGR